MLRDDFRRRQLAQIDGLGDRRKERRAHEKHGPESRINSRVNESGIDVGKCLLGGGHRPSAFWKFFEAAKSEVPVVLRFIAASTDPASAPAISIRSDSPIVGENEKSCPPERVEK